MDPGGDWGTAENSRGSGGPRSDPRSWAPREAAASNKTPEVTTPPPTGVCLLSCVSCRNSEDLSRVLQVVQRSQVTLNESVGSALVSSLAEGERVADIKPVLQQVSLISGEEGGSMCSSHHQMEGRLRVQSLASVLSLACRLVDADLALEYLAMWDRTKSLPESLVGSLVALSRESGRMEVMESLLTVLRELQQPVGVESAAQFRLWAQR